MIGAAIRGALAGFFAALWDGLLGAFGLDRLSRERRAAERRGAALQRGADAVAENEELRRDADIYMQPQGPDEALDELETRARDRDRSRRSRLR